MKNLLGNHVLHEKIKLNTAVDTDSSTRGENNREMNGTCSSG